MSDVDPWTFSRGELNKIFEDLFTNLRKESLECFPQLFTKEWTCLHDIGS